MNLNQLYYFAASAKHQHYTRAAEELFISQPSLSHAIAALEAELGTELFEKRGRNVMLTEHGRIFLKHVDRALKEIEQGRNEIARLTGAEAGHISLAYPDPMATHYMPPLIAEFLSHPENKGTLFNFARDYPEALVQGLKSREYDLAFIPTHIEDPELTIHPLFTEHGRLIVPKEHPLAQRESLTLADLRPYPVLMYELPSDRTDLRSREEFQRSTQLKIMCYSDDIGMLHRLVREGFGVAITLPIPEIDQMGLCAVPLVDERYILGVGIGHVKDRRLPPVVARFLQAIIDFRM